MDGERISFRERRLTEAIEPRFSIQLLQNLADYSGSPPHIRLGGNTQDYMVYDPDYEDFGWKKNPNSTAQGVIAA